MAKRCIIYTRVSLDKTGAHESVDRQEDACRKLADLKGWEVIGVRSDNSISAYSDAERPEWEAVKEMARRGEVDYIIAWHLDRITRSMLELEELILLSQDSGVGVATASGDIDLTTDVGRMVARILAAVARAEVERKAERQRLANEQRAKQGRPWTGGHRPFGYQEDRIHAEPREAAAIREAAKDVLNGKPLGEVAREWNEAGLISSTKELFDEQRENGKETTRAVAGWSKQGVRRVLLSPRIAGLSLYNGEHVAEGQWEAIIDPETRQALQKLLNDPTRLRHSHRGGRTPGTLLTSIARCGRCKTASITSSTSHGKRRYKCRKCGILIPKEELDAHVTGYLFAKIRSSDFAATFAGGNGSEEADDFREKYDGLQAKLEQTLQLWLADKISQETFTMTERAIRNELEALKANALRAVETAAIRDLADIEDLEAEWWGFELGKQRRIIEALLDVELLPVGPGRKFDPNLHVRLTTKRF